MTELVDVMYSKFIVILHEGSNPSMVNTSGRVVDCDGFENRSLKAEGSNPSRPLFIFNLYFIVNKIY